MDCKVVQELLPRYIAGLTSEETNRSVAEHLRECDSCRKIYEDMKATLPEENMSDANTVSEMAEDHVKSAAGKNHTIHHNTEGKTAAGGSDDPYRRMKRHVRRKGLMITLSICVAAIIFLLVAVHVEIPLNYDDNRMKLEKVKSAVVPVEKLNMEGLGDGYIVYPVDSLPFELKKEMAEGSDTSLKPLELLHFTYQGLNEATFECVSRSVKRDGQTVRLVFFCYSKTLWNMIRYGELSGISESGSGYGDMYDDSILDDGTYTPEYTEIYYLKKTDLSKFRDFSDGDFIKETTQASLIWSGNI